MISLDYLKLAQIKADGDLYRPEQLDQRTLQRAAVAIARGQMWLARPAMTVFFDQLYFWVASHFHRYEAALRGHSPYCEFWCDIKQGSKQAAIDFCRKSAT